MVHSLVPGLVTRPVGSPVPKPCLLPFQRLLPAPVLLTRPTGRWRVPAIRRLHSNRGTAHLRVCGQIHLPGPRLLRRPRAFRRFSNPLRHWTRSRLLILVSLCDPRTAGGFLLLLLPVLVPVPVPALLCHVGDVLGPTVILTLIGLLWVQIPLVQGCGRNRLVGLAVHARLLGLLPGMGLLLLTIRDVVLCLVRVLHLGTRAIITRGSSPH